MLKSKINFEDALQMMYEDDLNKRDVTVPLGWTKMRDDGMFMIGEEEYGYDENYGLSQVFSRMGMPVNYEKELLADRPDLVAMQYNHFAQARADKSVLVRFREQDGKRTIRGFLSDMYAPIDNKDVYGAFAEIKNKLDVETESFYMDEGRSRMRLVFPETEVSAGKLKHGVNDIIKVGFDIINSEIGRSSVQISPLVYRLVCTNGMKAWKQEGDVFRQRHSYVHIMEIKASLLESIQSSLVSSKDLIDAFISTKGMLVNDPLKMITDLGKREKFSERFIELTKEQYHIEPDHNMFGVINAYTRSAQLVSDEVRLDVERFAGKLLKS